MLQSFKALLLLWMVGFRFGAAIFSCNSIGSGCMNNGQCVNLGIYSYCECGAGLSGARCQYSSNCNNANGHCDGDCLSNGNCNCTNGLVGKHCNQLPTPPGYAFDPHTQLVEPCFEGALMVVRACVWTSWFGSSVDVLTPGYFNAITDSTFCYSIPPGFYPVDLQGRATLCCYVIRTSHHIPAQATSSGLLLLRSALAP